MKNLTRKTIVGALITLFLTSCALLSNKPEPAFTAIDLSSKLKSGEYQKRVDNFLLIFDASSSMFMDYNHEMKFKQAKRIANRMNQTIPEIDIQSGLMMFGPTDLANDSKLSHGMTRYSTADFGKALAQVNMPAGGTPLSKAIRVSGKNLSETSGEIALILMTDAEDVGKSSVKAAADLKEIYKERICIYTVHIGGLDRGRKVLEMIADAGQCGFSTDYASIESPEGMANFVERVFLKKADVMKQPEKDSDNDGVYDSKDQCPNTPAGIKVDQYGCPLPIKESVTIELRVEFDFDKDTIRPQYQRTLQNFGSFLVSQPELSIILEGHTDNWGEEEYNLDLSKRRAESVKRYLLKHFNIRENRISTIGYGYSRPETSNATEAGRQKNRRVLAVISAP